MDDLAPSPWGELLHLMRCADNPLASANYWLEEARFSALYPRPPNFTKLLAFLGSPAPLVNAKTNRLRMVPRLVGYPLAMQRNLLCFVATHSNELPAKVAKDFGQKCENCYSSDGSDGLLYYLSLIKGSGCVFAKDSLLARLEKLEKAATDNKAPTSSKEITDAKPKYMSKFTRKLLSLCIEKADQNHKGATSTQRRKRSLDSTDESQRPSKRQCLEPPSGGSTLTLAAIGAESKLPVTDHGNATNKGTETFDQRDIDSLKAAVDSNDIKSFCCLFEDKSKAELKQLLVTCYPDGPPSVWTADLCEHLLKSDSSTESLAMALNPVCLLCVLGLKSTAPRKLTQTMQRVAKKHGRLLVGELLAPLISDGVVDNVRSSFVLNVSKNNLASEDVCVLLRSALTNLRFAGENFDSFLGFVHGIVSLKFTPDHDCTSSFCNFVSRCGAEHTDCFAFVKAIMAFLKKPKLRMEKAQVDMIMDGLENNQTSLNDACLSLLKAF